MRLEWSGLAALALVCIVGGCGGEVVFDEGDADGEGGVGTGKIDPDEVERYRRACEARCSYEPCWAGATDAKTCARACFDAPKECATEFADYNECVAGCCSGACPNPDDPQCLDAAVVCPSAFGDSGE